MARSHGGSKAGTNARDGDGDVNVLMTTKDGPAVLFRNEQLAGHRSVRITLVGTKSNRDAIGARVRAVAGGVSQMRMVKSGSSYLSQSELPVTFGVGSRDLVDRVVIDWPSGRTDEFKSVRAGAQYPRRERAGAGGGATVSSRPSVLNLLVVGRTTSWLSVNPTAIATGRPLCAPRPVFARG